MIKLLDPGKWFSRKRHVLIHAHQFKNAGTTLDATLQREFAESFYDHRDDDAMREGASYLGPWLEQHRSVRALSSHWITFPLPQTASPQLHLVLLFRDPLERARSVYNFERRQEPAETPGSIKAKQVGFLEYVDWQMDPAQGPALRNFHTRYCSGDYLANDLALLFEKALQTVESTPLLGLVHRYEESMVLFEHILRPCFPGLDLSYKVLNSTGGHEKSLLERRATVAQELAPILERYTAANDYDFKLFQLVEQRFENALRAIPDLEAHRRDLHTRCQALEC